MFCPRCGREVSDTANFCGGCGLPKNEITKAITNSNTTQQIPVTPIVSVTDEPIVTNTNPQVENDLQSPVYNAQQDIAIPSDMPEAAVIVNDSNIVAEDMLLNTDKVEVISTETPVTSTVSYTQEYATITNNANQSTEQPQPETKVVTEMSTTDFIWTIILSGLPVIGVFYLVYLAFLQDKNKTKRSYARATLIIALFGFALALVFGLGLFVSFF